jgi:branched-chain amino acid transport system substrate-binding protein
VTTIADKTACSIGSCDAGADFITSIKTANEFWLTLDGTTRNGRPVFITDVHAIGLETIKELVLESDFYWGLPQQENRASVAACPP